MFSFLKTKTKLVAPINGKVIELSQVPDQVFAQKMAGDGAAIDSTGEIIVSPCDGTLTLIFKTNHAFGITLDSGIEILVHIGIDTVDLKGKGFERLAEEGQKIKAGDPVIKINREEIITKGYSLITLVLVTDVKKINDLKVNTGIEVKAGNDEILSFKTI